MFLVFENTKRGRTTVLTAEDVKSSFSMFLIKGISLKCKKQFLIMAVGNCRSSSNFWVFISQACFHYFKNKFIL